MNCTVCGTRGISPNSLPEGIRKFTQVCMNRTEDGSICYGGVWIGCGKPVMFFPDLEGGPGFYFCNANCHRLSEDV
jgi:hypothetical protein